MTSPIARYTNALARQVADGLLGWDDIKLEQMSPGNWVISCKEPMDTPEADRRYSREDGTVS